VHLRIKPGLRVVWRGPDAVQIGLEPGRGVVLEGLTTPDRDLLERLAEGVDEAALPADGPAGERARHLITLLRAGDVLQTRRAGRGLLLRIGAGAEVLAPDAAVWGVVRDGDGLELIAERARREVHVLGGGRLAAELTGALTAAGVGKVHQSTAPSLSWRPSKPAAGGAPRRPAQRAPDLFVLVRAAAADPLVAGHLLAADVTHLSVVVREAGLTVGPLVLPGRSPCLRCLDLHRADRDPAWPRLLAQLPGPATAADVGETVSSRLGAALAALQVLGHLDGLATADGEARLPASVGATLEVDLPDGLVSRRTWTVHPACGCGWSAGTDRAGRRPPAVRDVLDAPEPPVPASTGGRRREQGQ
jgi:hypothetical protein